MSLRNRYDHPDLDARPIPDVRDREWARFVEDIRNLRDVPEYRWADGTLADIQATIERRQEVTDGQRAAIQRIREQDWSPSRAYDAAGYRRRWR